jgi:predicted component of type VI protein secretion system
MAKLILKFEAAVLKEVPVTAQPVTIGRAPDNDLHIDNLAVSSHHAKIYLEEGKIVVEDLNSLNGTFVNNQRVQRATLKHGDTVLVGKHHIAVQDTPADAAPAIPEAARKVAAPKVDETVVIGGKARQDMLGTAPGTQAQAPARARIPTLVVLDGKTDKKEYPLTGKLTVIGKSDMATVRLSGWFAPKVAAQINKRDDGYFIGKADSTPKVNGAAISGLTKLNDGDMIEVGGVKLNFVYRD